MLPSTMFGVYATNRLTCPTPYAVWVPCLVHVVCPTMQGILGYLKGRMHATHMTISYLTPAPLGVESRLHQIEWMSMVLA